MFNDTVAYRYVLTKYANMRVCVKKIIILWIMSICTTSCAIYKSSFNCGEAKGARCLSMDIVDVMIDSGEIEKYHKKVCKKNKCYETNEDTPELSAHANNILSMADTNEFDQSESIKEAVIIKELD